MKYLLALAVVFGGIAFFLQARPEGGTPLAALQGDAASSEPQRAWIEVLSPSVTEIASGTKAVLRELATGDELDAGASVSAGKGGLAVIYFPDGSQLRLDTETTITIAAAAFDEKTESVVVRIALEVGKVWAKVVSVATPGSSWEVETANTVVTVRGTAFGVERTASGKSTVIGSEGRVAARRKQKQSDAPSSPGASSTPLVSEPEVFVTADTYIAVDDAAPKPALVVHKAQPELLYQEWVLNNKEKDRKIEERFEKIREEVKAEDPALLRRAFRNEQRVEFKEKIEERRVLKEESLMRDGLREEDARSPISPKPGERQTVDITKRPLDSVVRPELKPEQKTPIPAPVLKDPQVLLPKDASLGAKPVSIRMKRVTQTDKPLIEGDRVEIRAFAVLSNGTEQDVTSSAEWHVVGPIGRMERNGLFVAKLDASLSEVGLGHGFVVVSWKAPGMTEPFTDKSPQITVNARVEEILEIAP